MRPLTTEYFSRKAPSFHALGQIRLAALPVCSDDPAKAITEAMETIEEDCRSPGGVLSKSGYTAVEQAAHLLCKEWFVHLRFPGHEHVKIENGVPEAYPVYGSSGVVGTHNRNLTAHKIT